MLPGVFRPLKGDFIIFGGEDGDDGGEINPRRALWAPGDICQRRAPGRLAGGRAGVSGRCRAAGWRLAGGGCAVGWGTGSV